MPRAGARADSSPLRGSASARARASGSERTGSRRRHRRDRRPVRRPLRASRLRRAPTPDEQPHPDGREQSGEGQRERASGEPLLQRGADDDPGDRGQPDDSRRADLHLAVERVGDRADGGDQGDRRQRRTRRWANLEAGGQDQERNDDGPAADAEERAEEPGHQADEDEAHHLRILPAMQDALARLSEDPRSAALFLDVDGTLAPIVARPELASVPEETRAEVRRLASKYALVACISGRTGEEARRLVAVEGVIYVGVHGLELAPEAERWRETLRPFAGVDWPWLEDKGLTVALHWREAPDEAAARAELEAVAEQARAPGLEARWGRKGLQRRPPVEADKGPRVRARS